MSCLTVNGPLLFQRTVYWSPQHGSVAPLDVLLGIIQQRYSAGVREMACRLSLNEAFVPASDNLARIAQLTISHSALRELVEREGNQAENAIRRGDYGPPWTRADCTHQTVITGADGVMVPMVTEQQKRKRRRSESHGSTRPNCRCWIAWAITCDAIPAGPGTRP